MYDRSFRDYADVATRVTFILSAAACGWSIIGVVVAAFVDPTGDAVWWFMQIALVSAIVAVLMERLLTRFERE